MYILSFYDARTYSEVIVPPLWAFWRPVKVVQKHFVGRVYFDLTEAEAQFFIKDDLAFIGLFKKLFPKATQLQLEKGNLSTPYQRHGAEGE